MRSMRLLGWIDCGPSSCLLYTVYRRRLPSATQPSLWKRTFLGPLLPLTHERTRRSLQIHLLLVELASDYSPCARSGSSRRSAARSHLTDGSNRSTDQLE